MDPIHREDLGSVCVLTIDNPPVNVLGHSVRRDLKALVAILDADRHIRTVVLTGKGKVFVGGADISEFDRPPEAPHLPEVMDEIEGATKPWIAVVNGAAIGGGAELLLGCHYRIFGPQARVALPEAKLGIIPGAGGTQRLPRLIGLPAAIEVVTAGREIDADTALRMGLADMVAQENLMKAALEFAKRIASTELPLPVSQRELADPGAEFWAKELPRISKAAQGNPAYAAALAAIRRGAVEDYDAGIALERDTFLKLRASDEAAALRYLFFAERAAARPPELRAVTPAPLARVGVVGGGTMGSGIAAALANAGLAVRLSETSAEALDVALTRIATIFTAQTKRGMHDEQEAAARMARVRGSVGRCDMAECDLVIEAVFEDAMIKHKVFEDLVQICRPDAILATNTSYLDPEKIFEGLSRPDRFIALHFFSPAQVMQLMEIIPLKATSRQSLATGFALASKLGKIPIKTGNSEGFVGNRILKRYRAAAEALLLKGLEPTDIDRAMRGFGFRMGPFETQDMAGLDIAFRSREDARARGETIPETAGDVLVRAGRLGQKSGGGWYDYIPGDRKPQPSTSVAKLLSISAATNPERSDEEITKILIDAMFDEGLKILEEGIVRTAVEIDLVEVHGYGFPQHKGGPMFHTRKEYSMIE